MEKSKHSHSASRHSHYAPNEIERNFWRSQGIEIETFREDKMKQKSKTQFFTGIIFILIFLFFMIGIIMGIVKTCHAGNVMVYGNLPPWEITDARFDAVNNEAGVWVTERNPDEFTQWKNREGWVFTAPTTKIGFITGIFNLLYDADSGLIYFKLGTSIYPCAIKQIRPLLPNHVQNLDMGCKLEVEKNMVWLTLTKVEE